MRWLGLCILAITTSVHAASLYDPALKWNTVTTAHFDVHYPDGARNLAIRTGRIAEEVLGDVENLFGFSPEGPIELVLSDASDNANGSAQVLPKNIIRILLTAPTENTGLSSYDDWLRILLVHELAHICDIDQTHGVSRFLRWIFGKYIAWNGYAPQFLSEGAGVFAETVLTNTGRGRSSYVAMLLRMAALDNTFLAIDQANIQLNAWPGPNAAYFYGGAFHLWLKETYGEDAVRDLHRAYASMPVPYLYWFGAKSVLGQSLTDLWEKWRLSELAFAREVRQQVENRGVTASRQITFHGRNITGARYSPDGKQIVYSRSSPVDGSTVRTIHRDGSSDTTLLLQTYSPRFSFSPDGKAFYFSQNAVNERFNDYNDLYRYDLEADDVVKLRAVPNMPSLRARDPDVSRDGERLVFVQNKLHQSWVSIATLGGKNRDELHVRTLVPPHGDMQHAAPRFSPDGQRIALSTWFEGGKRDIVIVDANSGALLRRVTFDDALDGNPAWSPDGRYLLYDSDSDGIANVYAFDTLDESYFRITRVVGGAFQPDVAEDSKTLLFRNASGAGFDIHEMPFSPPMWEKQFYDPHLGYTDTMQPGPTFGWAHENFPAPLSRETETPLELVIGESENDYSIWRTLLPFQDNWLLLPALFLRNDEPSLSAATLGQDVLARHTYVLNAGVGAYALRPNWGAMYVNDVWYPTFVVGYDDTTVTFERGAKGYRGQVATASVLWPIFLRHIFYLRYHYDTRGALNRASQSLAAVGDFGAVEFGYTYRLTRLFPYSVSDEHGLSFAVAGKLYHRGLGADFDEILLNADARAYVNNPLFDNHVWASRLALAYAFGPDYQEKFVLGGAQGASLFTIQSERVFPLRGFPINLSEYPAGTGMLAYYTEYRLPLWQIDRGLWTLPIYFERLHTATFVDTGTLFRSQRGSRFEDVAQRAWQRARGGRAGGGQELRLDLNLGWAFTLTFRAGVAWRLVDHGVVPHHTLNRPLGYFSFGATL